MLLSERLRVGSGVRSSVHRNPHVKGEILRSCYTASIRGGLATIQTGSRGERRRQRFGGYRNGIRAGGRTIGAVATIGACRTGRTRCPRRADLRIGRD